MIRRTLHTHLEPMPVRLKLIQKQVQVKDEQNSTAVDDFGNIVNPMIVTGQVHGGLAQGIGQALMENCAYDENGQLLKCIIYGLCDATCVGCSILFG